MPSPCKAFDRLISKYVLFALTASGASPNPTADCILAGMPLASNELQVHALINQKNRHSHDGSFISSGWGQWSRTTTYRFRVCCPAIRRAPTNECLYYHIPAYSYKGSSRNSFSWLRILIFSTNPIPSSIETRELPP